MHSTLTHPRIWLSLALVVPLGACLSPGTMQQALSERDAEIQALRDERSRLKQDLELANADKESLQNSLQEASMKLALDAATRVALPEDSPSPRSKTAGYEDLDVPVEMRDGRLVITLPSAIAFSSGKAELSAGGRTVLEKLASKLKQDYPSARFFIEGHTDSDPIAKSSFDSNRALSMARAMSVLTFLVETCRIPDDQFVVVGHGQYQPVASNTSAEGKAKNRRVEIVVHAKGE